MAQFVRIINLILKDINPEIIKPFIDDVGIKGPYTDYNGEEALLNIRRFILEHI